MSKISEAQLGSVGLFRGLGPEALQAVAERMIRRAIPAGSILFRRGDLARGVYILVKGRVEIYRSTSDGREQVLHSETPVQSVAELPVFDGGEYPASARTAEDSELYFLSLNDFQRLYRENPEIADAVIRNLGLRLRKLVAVLDKVSLRSVPARVAKTLLEFAERQDALKDGGSFKLPRTQSDLAHELATSRETVARALSAMRKSDILDTEGPRVTILSLQRLEHVASGE
jgi:CRP/FNR family transcriptional regulator